MLTAVQERSLGCARDDGAGGKNVFQHTGKANPVSLRSPDPVTCDRVRRTWEWYNTQNGDSVPFCRGGGRSDWRPGDVRCQTVRCQTAVLPYRHRKRCRGIFVIRGQADDVWKTQSGNLFSRKPSGIAPYIFAAKPPPKPRTPNPEPLNPSTDLHDLLTQRRPSYE